MTTAGSSYVETVATSTAMKPKMKIFQPIQDWEANIWSNSIDTRCKNLGALANSEETMLWSCGGSYWEGRSLSGGKVGPINYNPSSTVLYGCCNGSSGSVGRPLNSRKEVFFEGGSEPFFFKERHLGRWIVEGGHVLEPKPQ